MAEIKGIDVSRWNGNIDWKTVASYGMGFAILRITEKGNIVDSTFEPNYKGCIENKIPVGVYKYSYATTIAQIKNEANVVIKTLNKRKLDYPVFLDIEDKCQENLSDSLMMKMIEAFRAIIVKAGYKFGIYCGYSWYQYQLPEGAKKYDCWVARYPNNDTGELQERLRVPASTGVIGWQYSSKATIPGIPTKTDRSVFYKDYSKSSTTSTNSLKPTTIHEKVYSLSTGRPVCDATGGEGLQRLALRHQIQRYDAEHLLDPEGDRLHPLRGWRAPRLLRGPLPDPQHQPALERHDPAQRRRRTARFDEPVRLPDRQFLLRIGAGG